MKWLAQDVLDVHIMCAKFKGQNVYTQKDIHNIPMCIPFIGRYTLVDCEYLFVYKLFDLKLWCTCHYHEEHLVNFIVNKQFYHPLGGCQSW
jgi:hypothetical protein